jgi:uncharacterized protein (TIGR02757 family)
MKLKEKLEYHYNAFDRTVIAPDPLQFLHLFSDRNNIEIIGFIASVFAYGNVKQILNSINKILSISAGEPYKFLTGFSPQTELKLIHRFYTSSDIRILFLILKELYLQYGSVEKCFMMNYSPKDKNTAPALSGFSKQMLVIAKKYVHQGELSRGIKFMFPDPDSGSACKRMNLFLRWMVRKDELDFGLWKGIRTGQLIIPVDTHIARIAQRLKLTQCKNVSWKMAEEITENLKKYDPDDPVKYDFALCHIGMRKINW